MRLLQTVGVIGAILLMSGCASGPVESENVQETRAAMTALGEAVIAELGGVITDPDDATLGCEVGGAEGVELLFHIEFDAPDYRSRIARVETLLVKEGYDSAMHISQGRIWADGSNGERVVLVPDGLSISTACIVD